MGKANIFAKCTQILDLIYSVRHRHGSATFNIKISN